MISLILPYWNRPDALTHALVSMAAVYPSLDLEAVIVDDGSVEPPVIPPVPFNARVVTLPRKDTAKNPCIPFNVGAACSRGEFIALSNAEIIHPMPVLGQMRERIKEPTDYILSSCWCPEENRWHCHSENPRRILEPGRIPQPTGTGFHFCTMMRRSLWDAIGGFDEEYREGAGYDDDDFVHRLLKAGARFVFADDLKVIHPKTGARTNWPPGGFERNRRLFVGKWYARAA